LGAVRRRALCAQDVAVSRTAKKAAPKALRGAHLTEQTVL
jgi:hypothetical protein